MRAQVIKKKHWNPTFEHIFSFCFACFPPTTESRHRSQLALTNPKVDCEGSHTKDIIKHIDNRRERRRTSKNRVIQQSLSSSGPKMTTEPKNILHLHCTCRDAESFLHAPLSPSTTVTFVFSSFFFSFWTWRKCVQRNLSLMVWSPLVHPEWKHTKNWHHANWVIVKHQIMTHPNVHLLQLLVHLFAWKTRFWFDGGVLLLWEDSIVQTHLWCCFAHVTDLGTTVVSWFGNHLPGAFFLASEKLCCVCCFGQHETWLALGRSLWVTCLHHASPSNTQQQQQCSVHDLGGCLLLRHHACNHACNHAFITVLFLN